MKDLKKAPTASTSLPDLKKMFEDGKRADGQIWYKPPGSIRGRWKPFQTWVKYLKLNLTTCRSRYYLFGFSAKDTFEKPLKFKVKGK